MDQAARGASALSKKEFTSAIKLYSEAISQNPGAVDYYIKRSTAHTRVSPPDHEAALKDAEVALSLANKRAKRELIAQAQLRRAIALFSLEKYADAGQCLQWVKKLEPKEKSLPMWNAKVDSKLKELHEGDERVTASVTENPDVQVPAPTSNQPVIQPTKPTESSDKPPDGTGAQTKTSFPTPQPEGVLTPASKIRHDWMQTGDNVIVTLYCKGIPKEKATVEIKQNSLEVSFPLPTGSDYHFSLDPLFSSIDRMKSSYKIMSTKAEFTLLKAIRGQKWPSLEGAQAEQTESTENLGTSEDPVKRAVLGDRNTNVGPAYPTSSKSGPKDWDKLASDLSKRPKKDPKPGEEDVMEDPGPEDEEGDPTNNFFKMLYKGADPDTKRAMMKSYTESNGTALSTNWSDVAKGPVETSPPDGMEAKKYEG